MHYKNFPPSGRSIIPVFQILMAKKISGINFNGGQEMQAEKYKKVSQWTEWRDNSTSTNTSINTTADETHCEPRCETGGFISCIAAKGWISI